LGERGKKLEVACVCSEKIFEWGVTGEGRVIGIG